MVPTATHLRQARTRTELVAMARQLTATRGLNGFTIPEVCEQVGISRRTFFNYFPSKESAVLGLENGVDDGLLAAFFEARTLTPALRRNLIEDLIDLAVGHFDAMNPSAADVKLFLAVLEKEPKLVTAAVEVGRVERERFINQLRDHQSDDATNIEVAIVTFTALVHLSVEISLRDGNATPFATILRDRVTATRSLYAPTLTRSLVPTT